jgi:hypothetical protein
MQPLNDLQQKADGKDKDAMLSYLIAMMPYSVYLSPIKIG